jgi:zinc D-Ala-D-Ala carboxypeptidase
MKTVQLTKNFSLAELTVTNHKVPNDPTPVEIERLRALAVNILQPLRDALGKPVIVNSAYRSPQVNKIVGGVSTSQHSRGEAADIRVAGMSPLELAVYIRDLRLPYDQLIREPTWVHVSYRESGRRQLLTMRYVNGKSTYYNGLS